ncbi:MAG TPA: hypothetical protein VFF61_10510 [Microvirga sp.]|nr:hypothetical protein [Microvirga sp.]
MAALLVLPAGLAPRAHDSFWIDWVWADQFTSELRRGNPYPRWLPSSHGGLGSPVFYYYPPLAFYLSGLLGLAGLSTYGSVIGAFGLGIAGSGLAMYHWLKDWTRFPLLGALFFMAGPYHMFDLYGRGALAETVAVAFIPLLALGIRRVANDRGSLMLTLAYAGLIVTHLPLALLTSLFFVAPYGIALARKRLETLFRLGFALFPGIGLSAIYLVPALALEPYRDVAALWALPEFRAENWSLVFSPSPGELNIRFVMAAIVASLVFPILYFFFKQRSGWPAFAAFCCLLTTGWIPILWSLPLLETVQFPYRVLPLAEFGIGTAIALFPGTRRFLALALFPPLALSFLFVAAPAGDSAAGRLEALRPSYPDVPENLPPGERPRSLPSQWALNIAAAHRSPAVAGGNTVLPTFYFPSWTVRCAGRAVPTFPDPETALLSYRGSNCTPRLRWTAAEKAGALTSAFALLLAMGLAMLRRMKRAEPVFSLRSE